MKIHFAFFENYGDYESPCFGTEETICGISSENVLEYYAVDDWTAVTCKKCLKLKDSVIAGIKSDEKAIIHQMGDMASFFS